MQQCCHCCLSAQVVCQELGISDMSEVFEWIDLDKPIGSASISQVIMSTVMTLLDSLAPSHAAGCVGWYRSFDCWVPSDPEVCRVQVHKAQLRRFPEDQYRNLHRRERGLMDQLTVQPGDTAWGICNSHGISLAELHAANRNVNIDNLQPGQTLRVPVVFGLEQYQQQQRNSHCNHQPRSSSGFLGLPALARFAPGSQNSSSSQDGGGSRFDRIISTSRTGHDSDVDESSSDYWLEAGSSVDAGGGLLGKGSHLFRLLTAGTNGRNRSSSSASGISDTLDDTQAGIQDQPSLPAVQSAAAAAVAHGVASGNIPDKGLVAVKVQYPGALETMTLDLVNLRATSAFLQKTELKFDLLSAVEELQRQIHLEFDFMR